MGFNNLSAGAGDLDVMVEKISEASVPVGLLLLHHQLGEIAKENRKLKAHTSISKSSRTSMTNVTKEFLRAAFTDHEILASGVDLILEQPDIYTPVTLANLIEDLAMHQKFKNENLKRLFIEALKRLVEESSVTREKND